MTTSAGSARSNGSGARIRADDVVEFSTSGHSGRPVVWLRSGRQLHDEVALLANTVVGQVDRVVNFAPTRHLYGRLLGDMLPAFLDVPVRHLWDRPLEPPDLSRRDRTLFVCLPSTWVMLRSLAHRIGELPAAVAIHSTGPTTKATRQFIEAVRGSRFRAVELFGSTETGAVAHRTLSPRPASPSLWTLFDDVSLPADPAARGERPLRVASPRLARRADMDVPPATVSLSDLVRPVGDRQFELLGRVTRLIKVNGRRLRLEHVESALCDTFPHLKVVCVPRRDDVRGEHYDLFYADELGKLTEEDVLAHLTAALPGVPVPRRILQVDDIPKSATGKVRIDRLLATAAAGGGRP